MQVGRIGDSVYINGGDVKRNTCNVTWAAAQPRPCTGVAGEAQEVVDVLAGEDCRHAHRVIVAGRDDTPLTAKCGDQAPQCGCVDVRLVGQGNQHGVAVGVLQNGAQTRGEG